MVQFDLQGKRGLITGGCGPLGWALVNAFADAGAEVVAADLPDAVTARSDAMREGVVGVPCNLMENDAVDSLCSEVRDNHGRLDFLVNNAAFTGDSTLGGYSTSFLDQTDDAFDLALRLNLAVPFRLSRRLTPMLSESASGCILNVGSIYGLLGPVLSLYEGTGMGNSAAYAASKGGLIQLTRYLATVLAPDVRVNCLAPGGILRGQPSSFVERYEERTPLGRMASEEDVLGAAVWLVGDAAAYVTGQTIAIDGGWSAW